MEDSKMVTPEFRLVFPNLFEAKPFMRNGKPAGEPKYGLTMLFAPNDIAGLKAKAIEVAKAKWPGRDLKELAFPLKNGDSLAEKAEAKGKDGSFYRGTIVLKASSKFKPQVVGADRQPILDKDKVYSGCYGYAEINFVPYDAINDGAKDGVTAYVNFVMKSRDGQRVAGRTAADVFAGIQGGTSNEDVLDDEIAF